MKNIILTLLLLIATVTATAQEDTFKGKTIAVIGDSYVRNHRRPMEETWHARVAERLGMNYRNYGRNGNSIAFDRSKQGFGKSMLERYVEMTDTADFVLVIAGHNDAGMIGHSIDSLKLFRQRLDSLCTGLRQKYPYAAIGFVTPWAVERPGFAEVIQTIREVCASHDFPVLDAARTSGILPMDTIFRRKYFQGINDTAHLNAKGHALLLDWGKQFLREMAGKEGVCHSMEEAFRSPSEETKPIMIWQWMDGLVSKEGITTDLEAYKAAGIGGVQQFLVGGPMQVMARDTTNAIGTDNWRRLMQHAISECARLGLTFGTHNCPGWSSSGYPTVTPEYSMQKLVWSKAPLSAPAGATIVLPRPEVDPQWNYYEDIAIVIVPNDSIVRIEDIIVLPPSVLTDGNTIEAPSGAVGGAYSGAVGGADFYRFGHTTNGKTNSSTAPAGGMGLECDKMSREAVKRFWDAYPAQIIALAGNATGRTFQRLEIDSYEAGGQEWTHLMPAEFQKRQGYDILPWLPALAGVTINSKEATQKMKRDWQETVSDLFAENYYGYMSQLASENGLQLMVQPYGTGSSKPFNPINTNKIVRQIAPNATVCAEFWAKPDNWGWKDVPRVVNAARSSGRHQVYAEGFTCWPLHAWKDDPAALKLTADRGFCLGINRMMLHAAAQNPWPHAKPGMTFGQWGTWWTPGQTWWKDGATPLFAYMSHCQALLQRGEYVDNFQSRNPSLTADVKSLQWTHRKDGDADIYFIANIKDTTFTTTLSFDINNSTAAKLGSFTHSTGRIPELWDPESGSVSEVLDWRLEDGHTKVALHFETHQSLFLVFRKATQDKGPGLHLNLPLPVEGAGVEASIPVDGHWTISLPDYETIKSDTLFSWSESSNPAIKYFSGTARYTTTIRMKKPDQSTRYVLDLGDVKNLAVVTVNGQRVANLWHAPFKTDITDYLHKGNNTLEIDVTNLWVNRMIGDEQEEDDVEWAELKHYTYAPGSPAIGRFMKSVPEWLTKGQPRPSKNRKAVISFKFYEKDAPLLPSGLLGPVVIRKTCGR